LSYHPSRQSDEQLRISVAHRLGCKACEPHTCGCGKVVDARGLRGLACRKSTPRQQRHSHLNDIIWHAMKRVQIPSVKEPVGLLRQDGKCPDGTTILPWSRESRWHRTSQSRTRIPMPTSATQPWKQELQPALPPPTRPTNTAHISSPVAIETEVPARTAGEWSWSRNWPKKRTTNIAGHSRKSTGIKFQMDGAATGKARRAMWVTQEFGMDHRRRAIEALEARAPPPRRCGDSDS